MRKPALFLGLLLGFSSFLSFEWQGEHSIRETIVSVLLLAGIAILVFAAASMLGAYLGRDPDIDEHNNENRKTIG